MLGSAKVAKFDQGIYLDHRNRKNAMSSKEVDSIPIFIYLLFFKLIIFCICSLILI